MIRAAIVGTGLIGTDLLTKIRRSPALEIALFAGIDPDSPGLRRAEEYGIATSTGGADAVLELPELPDVVFEATSAAVHLRNAPRYAQRGIQAVDLTPAKVGPPVVPAVSLGDALDSPNVNLTTCGGQATVPIVAAVSSVAEVEYAEVVSTVSSLSAGPGTRQNIDEFTRTTARALEEVGGAMQGKAIIVLNPAEPPILMRNTVYCIVGGEANETSLDEAIRSMVEVVQGYVPGYRRVAGPELDDAGAGRVTVSVFLEVTGAGDFLPAYAGNLDIMTAAAVAVGERIAERRGVVSA